MQINLEGKTKEQVAIERLRQYEPPEGYYLAFSGGKDSVCIYNLALAAGVKFDAHYSVTGIDPPELVWFIRKEYPTVKFELPGKSMWRGIAQNGLPTRLQRWCCRMLKEKGGADRTIITGVRWEESVRRKKQHVKEIRDKKTVIQPIIDWTLLDVWDFIDSHKLPYCLLYDTHFDRLGCIGCPMGNNARIRQFQLYPKIRDAWYRAAVRYYDAHPHTKIGESFKSGEEYWQWWLSDKSKEAGLNQASLGLPVEEIKALKELKP